MVRVRIDEILKRRGKSRYWLAKVTELTPLTISKLAKGKTSGIEFSTLEVICHALDCKASDLLDVGEGKTKKEK